MGDMKTAWVTLCSARSMFIAQARTALAQSHPLCSCCMHWQLRHSTACSTIAPLSWAVVVR